MNKNLLKDYLFMVLGSTLLAIGVTCFYSANHVVVGGVTGIGIILAYISKSFWGFEIPLSVTNIVFNIPLFFMAYKVMGFERLKRTIFATLYFSLALAIAEYLPVLNDNLMLAAIFGGAFSGIGLGFVFRGMGTTGGADLAASIIHRYLKHISVSKILLFIDTCIILLGLFVFGAERTMYAIIGIYISTKCIDAILEGMTYSKAAFVITSKKEEISEAIFNSMRRGVTALNATGMYTGEDKSVIMCVFSQKEIARFRDAVRNADKDAFIFITDVKEVLGKGFVYME
ncbi:MAG: YitT family protein [Lachnospiraceae bacterium]|nr:YitT family protein [Lachnospiraceae bacterium]